eukprot:m.35149 g.35149  ORF g.35149 m.35149 type:complete len:181 (-) comp9990_c0_seq7:84-626(-)
MMSSDFVSTDFVMDPGSPNPTRIKVQRRKSSMRMSELDAVLSADDCEWVCTTKLATSPEELEQAAIRFGVALQHVHVVRPYAKCIIRAPLDIHDKAECFVRATTDGWKTFKDFPGKYYPEAGDAFKNTMAFDAHIDLPCDPSADVEFAVCFKANDGNEYWDNNMGENHHIVKGEEVNPAY